MIATDAPRTPLFSRFLRSLWVELRKVLVTRGTRWTLVIVCVVWVIVGIGVGSVSLLGGAPEISVSGALLGMGSAVVIFAPMLGIMIMAGDWQTRDVMTVFALEPRRYIVVCGKAAAAVIVAAALLVAAASLALLASGSLAMMSNTPLAWDFGPAGASTLLYGAGVGILSGIAYGAAVPKVAVAIVFSLVQGFAIDPLLSFVPNGVGEWFRLGAIAEWGSGGDGLLLPALVSASLWLVAPMVVGYARNLRAEVQ